MTPREPARLPLPGLPLTFQRIELFCRVARLRSVTKAAESLHIAQPAVSAQLRSLEELLGARLVAREGRHLALTEAGLRFHRWCEDMLVRSSEIRRELSGLSDGSTGTAVIAASMTAGTYVLPSILVRYRERFPNTQVSIQVGNTRVATEAVRTGACDFAVLLLDPQQDLDGLELQLLWTERLVLVAAPGDTRVGASATAAQIAELPFVSPLRTLARRDLEDEMLYAHGVMTRNVPLELGHPEAIKRAVRLGAGVSFIESSAVREELDGGLLRKVSTPGIDLKMPVYLARRRDKALSEMQAGLMAFVCSLADEAHRDAALPRPVQAAAPAGKGARRGGTRAGGRG